MNKQSMDQIITKFDEYVQKRLLNKSTPRQSQAALPEDKIYHYDQKMKKKLKLQTKAKNHNFQNMIAQMKGLSSFVSIKQVLQKLGDELFKRQQLSKESMGQKTPEIQLQRVKGLEMQKIQQYLTNQEFWQRKYNNFVQEEDINRKNVFQQNQYQLWIDNILQKQIQSKQATGFNKKLKIINNVGLIKNNKEQNLSKESYFSNPNAFHRQKFDKNKQNQNINQHFQNFSKVSNLLTGRLRKLLKTKEQGKTQKAIKLSVSRRLESRAKTAMSKSHMKRSAGNKDGYLVQKQSSKTTIYRQGQQWRHKINEKLKMIMTQQGFGSFRQSRKATVKIQTQPDFQ